MADDYVLCEHCGVVMSPRSPCNSCAAKLYWIEKHMRDALSARLAEARELLRYAETSVGALLVGHRAGIDWQLSHKALVGKIRAFLSRKDAEEEEL